jgi:hypothetical protein
MAMIHVNRAGTNLGIFSEEDVREGLRAGRFTPTDLGWREGMATWQPLSQFPEFATTVPGAPPPQPPMPATTVAPAAGGQATPEEPAPRTGLPWENRADRPFFTAFIETLQMVLSRPAIAFSVMKREGGLADPLLYILIGGTFGFVISLIYRIIFSSFGVFAGRNDPFAHLVATGIGWVFALVLVPVFIVVCVFIGSAIVHLCLMIVGGAKQPFETTFRVICFAGGSVYPLMIIPVCGGVVSCIWGLVLDCIGIARAHETDIGRAVLAVLLPVLICCGGFFLLVTFGVIGALSALSNR